MPSFPILLINVFGPRCPGITYSSPHSIQIHWAGFLKPIKTERTQPLLWRSRQQRRQWAVSIFPRTDAWWETRATPGNLPTESRMDKYCTQAHWANGVLRLADSTKRHGCFSPGGEWVMREERRGVGFKGETTWLREQPLWTNTDRSNTGLAYVHPRNTGKCRRQRFLVLVLTSPLRQRFPA